MKYFVYYNDDYYENGGVGLAVFDKEEDALKFISDRISLADDNDIDCYRLIKGYELRLKSVEVVTKVAVDNERL